MLDLYHYSIETKDVFLLNFLAQLLDVVLGKFRLVLGYHLLVGVYRRCYYIYQLKSIDFVLMFIPIESAFLLPISQDNGLWQEA
jgi:hypothetical protein